MYKHIYSIFYHIYPNYLTLTFLKNPQPLSLLTWPYFFIIIIDGLLSQTNDDYVHWFEAIHWDMRKPPAATPQKYDYISIHHLPKSPILGMRPWSPYSTVLTS